MPPNVVILLNGVSSAGKTTLAAALQQVLNEPHFYVAFDHLEDNMLPKKPIDGAYERYLVPAMHRCIAAFAEAGAGVIVDHLLYSSLWLDDAVRQLAHLPVVFVGVHCSLAELERREQERGNRRIGQAERQLKHVHAHGPYDLDIDTTATSPEECALTVKRHLESGGTPSAFRSLALSQNAARE